jgi:hypothetical protein
MRLPLGELQSLWVWEQALERQQAHLLAELRRGCRIRRELTGGKQMGNACFRTTYTQQFEVIDESTFTDDARQAVNSQFPHQIAANSFIGNALGLGYIL